MPTRLIKGLASMENVNVHKPPIFVRSGRLTRTNYFDFPASACTNLWPRICGTTKRLQDGGFRKSVAPGEWLQMDNGPA